MSRQLLLSAVLICSAPAPAQSTPDWFGVDGFEFVTPATVFRFTDLDLRDPHVFLPITIPPFPTICTDFTDNVIPTTAVSFNASIQDSYSADANPADGVLDASSLLWFRPLRRDGGIARVDNGGADCLAPAPPASCSASATAQAQSYVYASAISGTCLLPLPGTTGTPAYSPAVATPAGPCFVTAARTFTFDNAGTLITLNDAQIAASFVGDPATGLANGLLRGFLRETEANQITIVNPALPGGSVVLSSLLAGGSGSCSSRNDKDLHNGESGWWFYFNFSAEPVTYLDP